jgi:hypothetical protein
MPVEASRIHAPWIIGYAGVMLRQDCTPILEEGNTCPVLKLWRGSLAMVGVHQRGLWDAHCPWIDGVDKRVDENNAFECFRVLGEEVPPY